MTNQRHEQVIWDDVTDACVFIIVIQVVAASSKQTYQSCKISVINFILFYQLDAIHSIRCYLKQFSITVIQVVVASSKQTYQSYKICYKFYFIY